MNSWEVLRVLLKNFWEENNLWFLFIVKDCEYLLIYDGPTYRLSTMSVVDSLKSRRILGLSLTLVGDQIEDRSHQKKLLVVDGSPESFRGGARESGESSEVDVLGDDEVQPWNDDVTEKLYEWLFEWVVLISHISISPSYNYYWPVLWVMVPKTVGNVPHK